MSDIEIEIDGKKLTAQPNQMVIQVADAADIYIPRFCYHKHLTVAANCRMCLVEVEKSPKPLPACATPCTPGMKVFTRSPKAIAAQKAVMEFLLINHPLDCPICDQGGECELQDLSMGYGSGESFYCEGKRSVPEFNIGPLVQTDMTRCIQCTRCVRFGEEVAGFRELGGVNRGEDLEITTYIPHALHSEVSGNIIDLCPVGALTSKPFRFTARAWELIQHASIAPHDCLGSHVYVHTRYGQVMRVVPHENPAINETWISDRDRFSYAGLYHEDRLAKPLIKRNNEWQEVSWQEALEFSTEKLAINPADTAAYLSPNSTIEEGYLLKKLLQGLGSNDIDFRSELTQTILHSTVTLEALENCDNILLIGSNIHKDQPVAGIRLRKAARKGAKVTVINMMDYRLHFPVENKTIVAPQHFLSTIEKTDLTKFSCIIVGTSALKHPDAAVICEQVQKHANVLFLTEGANYQGLMIAGAFSENKIKNKKNYILLNVDEGNDLQQAEFVLAMSQFKNKFLQDHADVILPMAAFTETSGTYVNTFGNWQSFKGVANTFGEARPAWKILRVLGNFLHLEGFDFESSEEIRREIPKNRDIPKTTAQKYVWKANTLARIGDMPIYSGDALQRHSKPLQATQMIIEGDVMAARVNKKTDETITVQQGSQKVILPVIEDKRVPEGAIYIPATVRLGELFGEIEIVD